MTDLGDFSELAPIAKEKRLSLSMKVNMLRLAERICSRNVTMESVDCICVRSSTEIIIVDMSSESKRIIDVVSAAAVLNDSGYLALQVSQNSKDHIRIICTKSGSVDLMYTMPEKVVFWKWITPKFMGLVTETSVYHLSIESGAPNLVKMFERTSNLANNRIIDYRCDPSEKWFGVIGTAPGSPGSPESLNLVKGNMQLFSVDQQCSQALEAHAASFASFKIPGNENPSTVVSFVTTSSNAGQVTSKLCVVELGAQSGKAVFTKKTDLFFPPGFDDDFPVAMQLKNLELALNLAKRGNLRGAETLALQRFKELFDETKYKEAAEFAADCPLGILRTAVVAKKLQASL